MALQVSPGITISERDLTTSVPNVSTSTGALVGHFRWGPVQKPILISDENGLVNTFREPNANTYVDFFTGANFLAYGNQLYTVRVVEESGANAQNAITASANTVKTLIKSDNDYDDNYSSGISGVGPLVAKYPGELGNSLKYSFCLTGNAYSSTLSGNLTFTSNSTVVTGLGTDFANELVSGDLLVAGQDKEVVKVSAVTNATYLILSSKYTGNTTAAASSNSNHTSGSASIERRWEYYDYVKKAPGTTDYANTVGGSGDELHLAIVDEDGEITGTRGEILEIFEGLSAASDAKAPDGSTNYYKDAINRRSEWAWWTGHPSGTTNFGSKASFTFTGPATPDTTSFVWGKDGVTPSDSNYNTGWDKFNDKKEIDVSILLGAGANQTRALHIINNIAEVRKDCVACISPRQADVVGNDAYETAQMDDIITYRNLLPSTSYAVMDSGWKLQYDKYNDVDRYIPLNGDIGGLMVRTDAVRDPWFSPAGYNRGNIKNVKRLAYNPKKSHRDQLYKNGINPVVSEAGQGTVLLGDKTMLSNPSAFDRINVRRLFITLEKAIELAANFTLFEQNDDTTRTQFRNLVEPFLRDVQGRRGITDFVVVCDGTNNTGEVIDRNEFVCDIYIKPTRSINFIKLNFIGVRTGVEFTEVVGSF